MKKLLISLVIVSLLILPSLSRADKTVVFTQTEVTNVSFSIGTQRGFTYDGEGNVTGTWVKHPVQVIVSGSRCNADKSVCVPHSDTVYLKNIAATPKATTISLLQWYAQKFNLRAIDVNESTLPELE